MGVIQSSISILLHVIRALGAIITKQLHAVLHIG